MTIYMFSKYYHVALIRQFSTCDVSKNSLSCRMQNAYIDFIEFQLLIISGPTTALQSAAPDSTQHLHKDTNISNLYIYTLLYTYIWAEAWIMLKYARVKSPWWDSNLPEPLFSVRDVQACHRSPVWKSASNMAIPEVSLGSAQWIHLNGVKLSKSAGELIQPTSVLNLSLIRSITDPQQWRVKILQKKQSAKGVKALIIFFVCQPLGRASTGSIMQYHQESVRHGMEVRQGIHTKSPPQHGDHLSNGCLQCFPKWMQKKIQWYACPAEFSYI